MRKKLLSLLTVLCLVLGMLPTTALAAASEAYENNEVALIITTDTEITEDVDGLVLVDAPCAVTVTDAKLSVGIVVSPDAAGATVVLAGTAETAEVVVLAAASVKVEGTANAGLVTVDAAEAELEIAGTAEITLTENAADTVVTAAEGASVTVDAAEGASVTIDVAEGAEAAITVAEGAAATVTTAEGAVVTLDVAEGAEVSIDVAEGAEVSITAADPDAVEVTGAGADSVTINGETAGETEEDAEEEEEEDAANEDDAADFIIPEIPVETATYTGPRIIWAPLANHDLTAPERPISQESVNGNVTVTPTSDPTRANVNITATNLPQHKNANNVGGYWIGFGVEVPADNLNEAKDASTYHYYVYTKTNGAYSDEGIHVPTVTERVYQVDETFYNTIYFDITNEVYTDVTVVVTEGEVNESQTITEMLESEQVVCVLDVTIDATTLPVNAAVPTSETEDQEVEQEVDEEQSVPAAQSDDPISGSDVTNSSVDNDTVISDNDE